MPSQTFTASGTFNVPLGITRLKVQCWGAGASGAAFAGAGGHGGDFAQANTLIVTSGAALTVTVGVASGAGGTAGDSWFSTSGTVLAKGGQTATPSIGDVINTGGTGASPFAGVGGGGGGGAGSGGVGGNGSGTAGGTAGTPDGGAGGAGGSPGGQPGAVGSIPGGGGGGSAISNSTQAAGARGQVIVTWTTDEFATVEDDLTVTDVVGRILGIAKSVSDSSSITELATASVALNVPVSDVSTITDSASLKVTRALSVSESLTVTDVASPPVIIDPGKERATEQVFVTDSPVLRMSINLSASDAITNISDQAFGSRWHDNIAWNHDDQSLTILIGETMVVQTFWKPVSDQTGMKIEVTGFAVDQVTGDPYFDPFVVDSVGTYPDIRFDSATLFVSSDFRTVWLELEVPPDPNTQSPPFVPV